MSIETYRENRRNSTGNGCWDGRNGLWDLIDVSYKDLALEFISVDAELDKQVALNESFIKEAKENREYLQEQLEVLKGIADNKVYEDDTEAQHLLADEILIEIIRKYAGSSSDELVKVYDSIDKWH